MRRRRHFGLIPTKRPANAETLRGVFPSTARSGAGKTINLAGYYKPATGKVLQPRNQLRTSSCVGQSMACAVDVLRAVRIGAIGLKEVFDHPADATTIYAGSRYEIAYKKHGHRSILRSKGAHVPYAAQFIRDYGTLYELPYETRLRTYNLSVFTEERCNDWERRGVPDDLEQFTRSRVLKGTVYVDSFEDACGALFNGYPIVVGSSRGFDTTRDDQGFCEPRGTWHHAMCAVGFDDRSGHRPGILILNSWGSDWVKGPKRKFDPEGSFWCDADTFSHMCQTGEAIAVSDFAGFEKRLG